MNNSISLKVTGKNINNFLKRLLINNISYNHLKKIDDKTIYIKVSYEDYVIIKKFKSIYKIKILKRYGINKYNYFIKDNKSFIISVILSIILLFILQKTCFKINIIHNNQNLRKLIREELTYYNIKELRLIPSFNKRKKIINNIINNNKDKIEWLEIEKKGSILIVKLTERKINNNSNNCENRHIVAKKSGILKKITAQKGVILKQLNDYVSASDIIISGDITKDDVIKGQVCARGNVYAETWYNVKIEYPLYYEEIKYLNKIKNNFRISFLNKAYHLKKNYTSYYLENEKIFLFDRIFPFKLALVKQRKTKTIKQKLSIKQASIKATKVADKKMKNKLSNDEHIISKKPLKFVLNDSKIEVDVFFKVYENITDYKKAEVPINIEEKVN